MTAATACAYCGESMRSTQGTRVSGLRGIGKQLLAFCDFRCQELWVERYTEAKIGRDGGSTAEASADWRVER